jgi:phytoene dehydrogenase-like protein
MKPQETPEVAIVGAGLAGLACARVLARAGRRVVVFDQADAPGGRMRTDVVDGFRLDRGFQVLLTAYPEARLVLDYPRLDLRAFYPGTLVRFGGAFHRVADPWRRPLDGLLGVASPIGSIADKLRVGRLRLEATAASLEAIASRPETSTRDALAARGFGGAMRERFFRPFLGGVFLEEELRTSSRMLEFVWKMFAAGDIAVPALGMEEIPRQLAAGLDPGTIRTGVAVAAVEPGGLRLADGTRTDARAVVVAADGPTAARLLGEADPGSRAVTCHYFAAPRSPLGEPILVLNGEGSADGPVNNLCVMSDVSPVYAPTGQALVSATVLEGTPDATEGVVAQLRRWYGAEVDAWHHLRACRIAHALPERAPLRDVRLRDGVYRCGDWCEQASINGALIAGRRAGEAVLADLRG